MEEDISHVKATPSKTLNTHSEFECEDEILPLVSICCPAYNQGEILHMAIDSFLLQKRNFPIEIIIHDDASNDNTVSVIKEYQSKYPKLIRSIFQTENMYSKGAKILTTILFPEARGKYIAICDGDDFWTDPFKLQKQVDFLDSNKNYGLIYSKARIYDTKTSKILNTSLGSLTTDFNSLLENNGIPASTVLFRKSMIIEYQKIINPKQDWKLGDRPIWLFIATQSKLKFVNEITTTYRKNSESVSRSENPQKNLDFIRSSTDISLFYVDKYQKGLHLRSRIHTSFYKRSVYFIFLLNDKDLLKETYQHLIKTRRFHVIPVIYLLSFIDPFTFASRILNLVVQKLWF